MSYLVGVVLALIVSTLAAVARFDRDRAFYPTVLIVVASYYVLFAVMSGSAQTIAAEVGIMTVFVALASVGFKTHLWIVAAGLVGHGLMDTVHGYAVTNTGMPAWWPSFCMAYDVTAGGILAWLVRRRGLTNSGAAAG